MKRIYIFLLAISALLLSACGLSEADVQATVTAAQGQAVNTILAQFTQIALLTPSATNTLVATSTPAATNTPAVTATTDPVALTPANNTCNVMTFLSDVTVSDGEEVTAGTPFTKTWQVRNDGTCTWGTDYLIVYSSGDQMSGDASHPLTSSVAPGEVANISVDLVAPAAAGDYTGYWAIADSSTAGFGYLSVLIKVP